MFQISASEALIEADKPSVVSSSWKACHVWPWLGVDDFVSFVEREVCGVVQPTREQMEQVSAVARLAAEGSNKMVTSAERRMRETSEKYESVELKGVV